MKIVTIRQALQHVVDNPEMKTDDLISLPVHELVCRSLFEIANSAQINQRGSMTRANVARGMIFNRLVGRRRAGSHPVTQNRVDLKFVDLIGGEITK